MYIEINSLSAKAGVGISVFQNLLSALVELGNKAGYDRFITYYTGLIV